MEKTWDYREKEIREEIAQKIESLKDGIEPKNEQTAKYAPVTPEEIVWRAAQIARGLL
jgi:hypothetical protein